MNHWIYLILLKNVWKRQDSRHSFSIGSLGQEDINLINVQMHHQQIHHPFKYPSHPESDLIFDLKKCVGIFP